MIVVLTSASYDVQILPAFVEHYASYGAEAVYVSVLELVPGLLAKTVETGGRCAVPVHVRPASARWQRTRLEATNKTELRKRIGLWRSDWYVPADLDEFIQFERPLPDIVADLGECAYAMGTIIDRIALDGSLASYDPTLPIAEQYPVNAHVTRDIMRVDDRKVVLCRGDLAVSSGHHRMIDQAWKMWPIDYPSHHYAWKAGRVEALERRRANYERLGIAPFPPIERLFEHLGANGGKFDVESLAREPRS